MELNEKSDHEKAEEESSKTGGASVASFWLEEIRSAKKNMSAWRKRAKKIVELYRSENKQEVYNILWANTETLRPVMYVQPPKPEVQRKYLDLDPVARASCKVIERCLTAITDTESHPFDDAADQMIIDFLLAGRGVLLPRYDVITEKSSFTNPITGADEEIEEKVSENLYVQYVYWENFLHSDNRVWQEVWWNAFGFDLTREDLVEQFGEDGKKIPLSGEFDWESSSGTKAEEYKPNGEDFAKVWEIWDKRTKKVIFVAEGYDKIIKESPAPFNVEGFFPTPPPLDSIFTTDTLVPVPEYTQYQNQAEELNILTKRLYRLIDALRVKVVYDSGLPELKDIFKSQELEAIPLENYTRFSSQGGFQGAMDFIPIQQIADVISKIIALRQDTLATIYEITGISDIIRGSTDPRETATAQRFKTQYGGMRVQKRQRKVQKYFRSIFRILGEIMAEHFEPETLLMMSNFPESEIDRLVEIGMDQIVALLRNDKMRGFKIDIETDSMIAIDESSRKEDVVEFMQAASGLLAQLQGAAQSGIISIDVARAIFLFAGRRFKVGRQLEQAFETIGTNPPPEKPDPALQIQMMKNQVDMARLQQDAQSDRMKYMMEMRKTQLEYQKLVVDKKIEEGKMMVDILESDIARETAIINARGKNRSQ